ncbi:MAG: hypothetical protein L6R41_006396 [Letrouitia leprolyta]|nr:MAG: hypothetical protein L6R41_006396 [Letrouitia leprolyta]
MSARVTMEVDDGIPSALQKSVRERQELEAQLSWSETATKNMTTISPHEKAKEASEGDVVSPRRMVFTPETAAEVHLFASKRRISISLRRTMARQGDVENLLDITRKTSIPLMTVLAVGRWSLTNSEDEASTRILGPSPAVRHQGQASFDDSPV